MMIANVKLINLNKISNYFPSLTNLGAYEDRNDSNSSTSNMTP